MVSRGLKGEHRFFMAGLVLVTSVFIAKKYVHLMNGRIEFQSKLYEGSTFIVTLPGIRTN